MIIFGWLRSENLKSENECKRPKKRNRSCSIVKKEGKKRERVRERKIESEREKK